jgi:branched-subunit amino acid aminotransferase/4-amino-4-deoxychorismate lyase
MCDRLIYLRGALRPADDVSLAREADTLATREGIFETLLVADGVVRDACAHVDRLFAAADSLGLGLRQSRTRLLETVRAVASGAQTPWARLRITAFEDGDDAEIIVTTAAYVPPAPTDYARGVPVTLARNACVRRADESRRVKSLAWRRQGEALLKAAPGSYEVVLLNDSGRLAEGVRTNVVVRRGGIAMTPPLSEGCLPGTVRNWLVRSGAVLERDLEVSEVLSGGEVVLTNSLVGVIPVARIDDTRCEVVGLAGKLRAAWEAAHPTSSMAC